MSDGKKRAPGLYGVILFKLAKGLIFLLAALGIYSLSNNNLPDDFRDLLLALNWDPEKEFWVRLGANLEMITPKNIVWVASGAMLYSSISLLEGVGLIFRQGWAGWLAIAEGAFFIPIEVYELSRHFTWGLAGILVVNTVIVWYLFRNRHRLFHHGHVPKGQ